MTNQSTAYQAFFICAALLLFAVGPLNGGSALAAGVYNVEGDFDGDGDIDADDLREMSDIWLMGEDSNEPNFSDVYLTPEGGLFELPGGLVIDVPAGAVDEDTSFQIRLLEAEEAEPYLTIGQRKKDFMGGFEIDSDGIVFNVPIFIRFPIEPLHDPNSLPYIYSLNTEDGTLIPDLPRLEAEPVQASYSLMAMTPVENGYIYDQSDTEAVVLAETAAESGLMYDPRNAIAEFMISITPPERKTQMLTELYNVLGHSDCVANPCRCLRQFVVSQAADWAEANLCDKVTEHGSVQFPDCEGQPVEAWDMEHESIQIAYRMNPDRDYILCDGSLTMTVDVYDLDSNHRKNHKVTATSSRPDLLEVTSFGGNLFLLERVGKGTGFANVVIDAGCEITRTVPIKIGCETPDLARQWSVSGDESWWGCQDPEDNGTYSFSRPINFSQNELTFSGSISYVEHYEDHIETYEESYSGELTPDCEIDDRCVFKVTGSTSYTEEYIYEDSEPYVVTGIDTFSGSYEDGVITLTTLGSDTSGDSCQTSGSATLTR